MKRPTLDIGLDIDNVLYPFSAVWARYAEGYFGVAPGDFSAEAESWAWYKDQFGLTTAQFLESYADGVHQGVIFTEGAPEPGSLRAALDLAAAGHRLHFVSARAIPGVPSSLAFERTAAWLRTYGFPVTTLSITDDKSAVRTDVFLDDAPHNIETLEAAGHEYPLLWDRLHNRKADIYGPRRVQSWREFAGWVRAIQGFKSYR